MSMQKEKRIVYIAGAGCGAGTQTRELQDVLTQVEILVGPQRLLEETVCAAKKIAAALPEEIAGLIRCEEGDVCVLQSGDSGFFSGTRKLLPLLEEYDTRILPGISSLQLMAARCGRPWQEWRLVSAHGVDCDAVFEVCGGKPVFFLTGGKIGPDVLCAQLTEAGLGDLEVTVGEDLGTAREQIRRGSAQAFSMQTFSPLSVLLAEPVSGRYRGANGIPDNCFIREERIPMTKQAVRALILSLLSPAKEELCWDIGAGTGSVGIELALRARTVYGVEREEKALALAEKNRRALGAWNLHLVKGSAPEALAQLPEPDVVFVGGSGGKLEEILRYIHDANAAARVCVSAITLENAAKALSVLSDLGLHTEIVQISVSSGRKAGGVHMMTANNPVFLITGVPA